MAAHATNDMSARIAAEAGVDSIEHGYVISDEVLKIMAEKKIYLVPTDGPVETYLEIFVKPKNPTPEKLKAHCFPAGGVVGVPHQVRVSSVTKAV